MEGVLRIPQNNPNLFWFGSVSLIHGLFNAKAILEEEQYYLTHNWEEKEVDTFSKGISPEVNVIVRLEFRWKHPWNQLKFFSSFCCFTVFRTVCNGIMSEKWQPPGFTISRLYRITIQENYLIHLINTSPITFNFTLKHVQGHTLY